MTVQARRTPGGRSVAKNPPNSLYFSVELYTAVCNIQPWGAVVRQFLLCLLIVGVWVNCTFAADTAGIRVLRCGQFAESADSSASNETAALVETEIIPAVVGVRFGMQVESVEKKALQVRVVHPPLQGPSDEVPYTEDGWQVLLAPGQMQHVSWSFTKAHELVPGQWTLILEADGAPVYEKKFTIVMPEAIAESCAPISVASTASASEPVSASAMYCISTGLFRDRANARELADKLEKNGLDHGFRTVESKKSGKLVEVNAGCFSTSGEAEKQRTVVTELGFTDAYVRTIRTTTENPTPVSPDRNILLEAKEHDTERAYCLQTGAFISSEQAERAFSKLKQLNYFSQIVQDKDLYRVVAGCYEHYEEAAADADILRRDVESVYVKHLPGEVQPVTMFSPDDAAPATQPPVNIQTVSADQGPVEVETKVPPTEKVKESLPYLGKQVTEEELGLEPVVGDLVMGDLPVCVVVNAYMSSDEALRAVALLRQKGLAGCILPLVGTEGALWHTVEVGCYPTSEKATERLEEACGMLSDLPFSPYLKELDGTTVRQRRRCFKPVQ